VYDSQGLVGALICLRASSTNVWMISMEEVIYTLVGWDQLPLAVSQIILVGFV